MANLIWKFIAISATAICVVISAPAIADTEAYSYLALENFQVFNNDTGIQLDISDFSSLEIGDSASASAVTSFASGVATASADTLETALACSGNCGGIAENDPAPQVSSNFGRGDTSTNGGAVITGIPGRDIFVNVWTVAEGRQNVDEGWTSGLSGTRNATEFTFALAQTTDIIIKFDALAELFVKLEQPLIQAQAAYAWSVTVVEVATGNQVFSWVPNGGASGITGGTELSDPFALNNARGQLSTGQNGTGAQSGTFEALLTLAGQTAYRWTINHNSQVNTEVEPIQIVEGGCRMTGGNATLFPVTAEDGTLTWSYEFEGPADEGKVTTGGQINAPSGQQPPAGHWEHTLHDGAEGNFSFHVGTSSAPAGTEISSVECADPGWCVQARCAPFKQLFWTGIGNFANQHFDAAFPGCNVIKGNKGTQHFVKAMIGDFGENDRPTKRAALEDGDPNSCNWFDKLQAAGYPGPTGPWTAAEAVPLDSVLDNQFGDKNGQVCDKCPDYYQIEIHCTTDPGSDVIYSFAGFLGGGNYQIHPETGEQCPVTEELVPELFETTTSKDQAKGQGKGKK